MSYKFTDMELLAFIESKATALYNDVNEGRSKLTEEELASLKDIHNRLSVIELNAYHRNFVNYPVVLSDEALESIRVDKEPME
jgi:hypothetical protein